MCGIAAHFCFQGAAAPLDLDLISHRGPDASGSWQSSDGQFWLGNTRLAILDLSPNGAQPMVDPATGNVLVINGEIYNHFQLRRELGQDISWRGTSDTETVLQAYARWGPGIVARLKGMFAFVLYDHAQQELFIARDRLGIKPLYYILDQDGIRFASEIKILINDSSQVTTASVGAYLQWGASPENQLLFPEIKTVPPGHCLTINESGKFHQRRYWPAEKAWHSSPEEVPRRLRQLLENAVEEHLLSDVPVASFLSGGIDSSIITAIAAQRLGRQLQTFTIGFELEEFDESAIAREVADRYHTAHFDLRLTNEQVLQLVSEAVENFDLPSVDAINTYIVARAVTENGVKVALSGLGGDELFGGYPGFRDVPRLKWLAWLPGFLRGWLGGERLTDLPAGADTMAMAQWRRRFFTDAMLERAGLPYEPTPIDRSIQLPDDFARISWSELTGYMRHMLLRDSDQMSMAVSLELRVPFLDHELVEYSLGLPAREKRRYGPGKGLLVESCRDLLPPSVYERPKSGFALPMKEWMSGPLAVFVADGLRELVRRELLRAEFVVEMETAFQHGGLHWTRLWSMVVLGHFVRRTQARQSPDENLALHSFA